MSSSEVETLCDEHVYYSYSILRGHAYVEFDRAEDAKDAMKHMNGGWIDGEEVTAREVLALTQPAPANRAPRGGRGPMSRGGGGGGFNRGGRRRSPPRFQNRRPPPQRRSRSPRRSPPRRSPVKARRRRGKSKSNLFSTITQIKIKIEQRLQ